MKYLVYTLFLCVGFLILCIGAIFMGYRSPQAKVIPELQRCGDSLCYLGIVPGVTTWNEQMSIIRAASQLKVSENSDNLFVHSNPNYAVEFLPKEINFSLTNAHIVIGDIMSNFGPPCYVSVYNNNLYFGYSDAVFTVTSDVDSLSPNSQVTHIVLRRATNACLQAGLAGTVLDFEWLGLRNYLKAK